MVRVVIVVGRDITHEKIMICDTITLQVVSVKSGSRDIPAQFSCISATKNLKEASCRHPCFLIFFWHVQNMISDGSDHVQVLIFWSWNCKFRPGLGQVYFFTSKQTWHSRLYMLAARCS